MKTKKSIYEDPTGGGEDIVLIAPEWVNEVPTEVVVTNNDHDRMVFYYSEDLTLDANVEDDDPLDPPEGRAHS